jgi:hypothetical protein
MDIAGKRDEEGVQLGALGEGRRARDAELITPENAARGAA